MPASLYNSTVAPSACSAAALAYPLLSGAEFLSLDATTISNYTQDIPSGSYANHGAVSITETTFCNITVSYTHPGENDTVHVQAFLPQSTWNGRLQHIGGAGWQAGLHHGGIQGMLAGIGEGYATIGTDAGLGTAVTPETWALLSPGTVNLDLFQNLMTVSLNDAAIIGKSLVNAFYGQPPAYSYFSGCSQGGRQGLLLAQRYPDAYDGIAASAPAINWNELCVADYYPTMLVGERGEYPAPCEFTAITDAMVAACDGLDGVVDRVITDPSLCEFDPYSVVGHVINCTDTGAVVSVSETAAYIANAATINTGARSVNGSFLWHGVKKGAPLVVRPGISIAALTETTCSTSNGTCVNGAPYIFANWIKNFVLKNASADLTTMKHAELDDIFQTSTREYASTDSSDPDPSQFRARGGKLIGYHGLADTLIETNGTTSYYDAVMALDENVHDFYRLYLAPGLGHCSGGYGAYPDGIFDSTLAWVEEGVVPDTLNATSIGTVPVVSRPLCPYPKKQYHDGKGNSMIGEGFYCE